MSALVDGSVADCLRIRDGLKAGRTTKSLSPPPGSPVSTATPGSPVSTASSSVSPPPSPLSTTPSEGDSQQQLETEHSQQVLDVAPQGTDITFPHESLGLATPLVAINAWAGESFVAQRETPRRLLPAPVYRNNPTPGQAVVLNDELVAMRLTMADMKTVICELRDCVIENTTAINRFASQTPPHDVDPLVIPPASEGSSVPERSADHAMVMDGDTQLHNVPFIFPRRPVRSATSSVPDQQPLQLTNRFSLLAPPDTSDRNEIVQDDDSRSPQAQLHQQSAHAPDSQTRVQPQRAANRRRPVVCCNANHLNNFKPVRPGDATFARATGRGRRAFLLSDSMMQRIRKREFYQHTRAWAQIKTFPGATARYLHHHMLPFIIEQCPSILVVHGGTNDLRNRDKSPEQIAEDLLSIGLTAKSLGVETVMFSGLVIRRDGAPMDRKRKAVNDVLRERCAIIANFNFLANDNIVFDDIDPNDQIHLLEQGSVKLANNILHSMNSLL